MAYSLTASESLPWIEPAQPFVKLVGAIGIGGAALTLLVQRVKLDPDTANQIRCFPGIQLKLVDLLGQFLQNGAAQARTLAGQADIRQQQLTLKAVAPAGLAGSQSRHLGEAFVDLAGVDQHFRLVPRAAQRFRGWLRIRKRNWKADHDRTQPTGQRT